jgi:hypothetical protein
MLAIACALACAASRLSVLARIFSISLFLNLSLCRPSFSLVPDPATFCGSGGEERIEMFIEPELDT